MKIFGPVFWYELKQIGRRQRLALYRALFATLLLVALFLLYSATFRQAGLFHGQLIRRAQLSELAAFATSVFAMFTALQFAVVILFTPALTANSLAEERTRDTLVFLLTTQLTSREIILGKLFTRLLQVAMIVLTSLPMLGFLQLFGGVDQVLIIASFVGVGITAFSLGCLGMLCAVYVKKPQRAAWRAYQWIVVYLLISTAVVWIFDLPSPGFRWAAFGNTTFFVPGGSFRYSATLTVKTSSINEAILENFNIGNPFYAGRRIAVGLTQDVGVLDAVLPAMRDYLIFHIVLAIACLTIAVARLRAVSAKQISGLTFRKSIYLKPAPHPPVKERPVLWKEYYCESKPRQRWASMFFSKWFFFASFLPAWVLIVLSLNSGNWHELFRWIMAALSFGGTLVAGGLLVRVGLQAARSIGSERDRQTLDSLLTTEIPADEILRDKWWGSLLSGRWVFLWLLIHWALGALTLAIGLVPALSLVAEIIVFGSFMVSLGLYGSVRFGTTKLAVSRTLLSALVGTLVVPWLLGQVLTVLTSSWQGLEDPQRNSMYYYGPAPGRSVPELVSIALSPIQMLYHSVSPDSLWPGGYGYYDLYGRKNWLSEVFPAAIVGMTAYGVGSGMLWQRARRRFRRSFGVHGPNEPLPAKGQREFESLMRTIDHVPYTGKNSASAAN